MLAVSSGTAAMHLALLALGVGPGDEVITSPITWPATANVIEHCGATPVFCDVREDDLNLDPALLPAARHRADEGDPPRPPRRPAVRPRPDPRARPPGRRGRRPRAREPLPRPQARRALRRDLLLALRDEEPRRGRGRARRDEPRRRRGGDPEHAAHAPRRRLALRPGDARASRRTSPTCSRRSRSSSSTSSRRTPRSARGSSRSTTRASRGSTASRRSSATRATRTRCHLYVVRIDPERRRRDARRVPACARRGADRDEHPLPARCTGSRGSASGTRRSRRCRSPSAPATRCSRCRSRRRTPTRTSSTRSTPSGACTRASRHETSRSASSLTLGCSRGSRSRTSSGRSTSATTLDVLARRESRGGSRSRSRS